MKDSNISRDLSPKFGAQKIRLADIAERAKVSISSVSRVVRGLTNVEDSLRYKIETAMDEMGIDRSYFSKKTAESERYKFIALYIHDILNPFYAMLVKGIEDVAGTHEYGIILCDTRFDDHAQYKRMNRLIKNHDVKGVIHVPLEFSIPFIENLIKDKTPLVLVDNIIENSQACYVTSDNRGGVCNAVRYLLSLGHRRILYLAGDVQFSTERDRYAGYHDALTEAGIPEEPALRAEGYYDWQKAHDSVSEKIEQGVDFTAIFCANDLMAFAAKQALEEHGCKVPEDVSLMGFDDIPFSSVISLTTFSLPAYEMGRNAMFMLIDLINNRIVPPKHIVLHPTLQIRKSCRKIDTKFENKVRKVAAGRLIRLGFTPPAASEFYDIIEHGAYTMMKELNDRFDVNFEFEIAAPNEHQAVESQVAAIENWVANKFDAILVCSAGDFEAMNTVYQKAMDNGTAIYMFNMPTEMWDENALNAVSVIGYDNHYQAGYLVGQYSAEKLNGKGNIILIWGVPGYWATSRKSGFIEAIKPYPGLKILGEQRGDYVQDKGRQAAENLLKKHPGTDLIYGENEEMAQGAAEAVETMGLKHWDGKDGIITIGADGLSSGYESIRKGKLSATVNVGPVLQGREFIMAVFMHEVFGYSVDKIINVPTTMVDRSNVDVAAAYTDWALGTTYP